jgi:hypothetical protein
MGHSRLIHSAPVTTNVRYASNSYRIIAAQRMTLSANSGLLHPSKLNLYLITPAEISLGEAAPGNIQINIKFVISASSVFKFIQLIQS